MTIAKHSVRSIVDSDLSRTAKLTALRDLEADLVSRSRAAGEGMTARSEDAVSVQDLLRQTRQARHALRDPELSSESTAHADSDV